MPDSSARSSTVPSTPREAPRLHGSLEERLRDGEMDALAEAYDAHSGAVRVFARRLVGDEASAEDLVQETFLSLPSAMKGYRGTSTLRTFVIGVATNHARHYVRAAARRRAAYVRSAEEQRPAPATPEERTTRRELANALIHALDELSFDQRVAVVLCEVEERTAGEVAAIVGAPEATIRTRVFHAKKRLREILAERGLK